MLDGASPLATGTGNSGSGKKFHEYDGLAMARPKLAKD
jgi:hypothetical protein